MLAARADSFRPRHARRKGHTTPDGPAWFHGIRRVRSRIRGAGQADSEPSPPDRVGTEPMTAEATARPRPGRARTPRRSRLAGVSLSIGIAGLPNVGKSTVFTALTRASAVASN